MIEGIFGAQQSLQIHNNNVNKSSNLTQSAVDFKNMLVDLARSANMAVASKGTKEGIAFSKWRELEDNLYFNPEEEKEDAAVEYFKKLKRILKEKFGS